MKFTSIILLAVLMFCLPAFGYVVVGNAPTDLIEWFTWVIAQISVVKGQGWPVATSLIIVAFIGITKFTFVKPYFDKLGSFKFLVPIILGAIAELLINFPSEVTIGAVFAVLVSGATGSGAVSIAWHHILDSLKTIGQKKEVK